MGGNNSISEVEENDEMLDDEIEEENEEINRFKHANIQEAKYVFHETDNIQALPSLDEPIRLSEETRLENGLVTRKLREEQQEKKMNNLKPIDLQAINNLAEGNDVIIDDYDFYTLISLINSLIENHNIAIISTNSMIGKLYEYFNETSTHIGITTKNLIIKSNSNILDIELCENVDFSNYQVFICLLDQNCNEELIRAILKSICSHDKPIIIYRIFPSHGFADQIILEELVHQNIFLHAPKPNIICQSSSFIDFHNCSNISFPTLQYANEIIRKSGYQFGFEIFSKDSIKPQETRIRFFCKCSKNKDPCPFYIYLKFCRQDCTYKISQINPNHNHELDPSKVKWKLLNSKQVRLVLSLRRNKMPILEINKILGDLYNIDINLTNNQIRKLE